MSVDTVAVVAEDISKRFVLQQGRVGDLRELVGGLLRKPKAVEPDDVFYALRDVDFTIRRGETVGIVGHNGSGKSTLLKMLTGILKPDTGHIKTFGRIGALIEVGAGFHPDLSGRENIFLNGSIMGLSRRELAAKFDEIVTFAGLERFIDTPVKRYSSGMYMRLGFAIATNIEADILLIDEVLAVGDGQFQKKCVTRLREFSRGGGTVVFVSHAMAQVAELCDRCLWLDHGRLLHDGATSDAIDKYEKLVGEREDEEYKKSDPLTWEAHEIERKAKRDRDRAEAEARERLESRRRAKRSSPDRGRIVSVRLHDTNDLPRVAYAAGEMLHIEVTYRYPSPPKKPVVSVDIHRLDGDAIVHSFTVSNFDHALDLPSIPGEATAVLTLGPLALVQGEYRILVNLVGDSTLEEWWETPDDTVTDAARFSVTTPVQSPGVVYMPSSWHVQVAKGAAL